MYTFINRNLLFWKMFDYIIVGTYVIKMQACFIQFLRSVFETLVRLTKLGFYLYIATIFRIKFYKI